jgi:hypothetical protein
VQELYTEFTQNAVVAGNVIAEDQAGLPASRRRRGGIADKDDENEEGDEEGEEE